MGYGLGVFVMATPELNFSTEISGVYGLRSHHSGEGEVSKSGGHWLAAEVGIGYRITDRVQVSLKGRMPIFTDTNGRQLTETFSLTSGLSIRFGDDAEEEDHDHSDHEEAGAHEQAAHEGHDKEEPEGHIHDAQEGHDHSEAGLETDRGHGCNKPCCDKDKPETGCGPDCNKPCCDKDKPEAGCGPDCNKPCCNKDKPEAGCGPDCNKPCCNKDAPKADVSDAATGGKSFVLKDVLVPGKVTVIDYWAEWCKPCKVIGKFLEEIAKDHAHLAVRKVELIDFDSPVAKEHLKGVPALPVVRIYDEKGRRLVNLVGAKPERVRSEVLGILAKKQAP
jgi:thiol-disulfide isomerase/thioredoxin